MLSNVNLSDLENKEKVLKEDLQAIDDEFKLYLPDQEKLENFLNGANLPIENMKESLEMDYNYPRTKYSLHDFNHGVRLRKLFKKTVLELEDTQSKLRYAKIDMLLNSIEKLL